MIIYPAIDLKNKKCVRLVQGREENEKVYSDDPVQMALHWESLGAQALHLIDLDRAIKGESQNGDVIQAIVEAINIPVQVGGGIRSVEAVEALLGIGCQRVILGTKAYQDKDFLTQLVKTYDDKIVVSVDTKEGKLAILGWTEQTDKDEIEFLAELQSIGINTIVYTDISKDGMMQGPSLDSLKKVLDSTQMKVIASGGVTTKEDIEKLKEFESLGLVGAIVGKALYEGTIKLEEVV